MDERFLITGATGFVGACLTENLVKEGNEVHIIARKTSDMWRLNKIKNDIVIHEVDLCDSNGMDNLVKVVQPENIYHLATYGAYYYQNDWRKTVETNIVGSMNLINAVTKVDFKSFINIGSSSEYGTKTEQMKEDMVLEPINTYGVTKATATMYASMIGKNLNKPIASIRIFSAFGYYEEKTRLVPTVALACLKGENPKLASGDAVRDFIFIEDIIDIIKHVSNAKDINGKIFNAGTGRQHTVSEMVNAIIEASGNKVVPQWGSAPGRRSDTNKWEANTDKLVNELQWEPKHSFEDGVKKTVNWFKENFQLYKEE